MKEEGRINLSFLFANRKKNNCLISETKLIYCKKNKILKIIENASYMKYTSIILESGLLLFGRQNQHIAN